MHSRERPFCTFYRQFLISIALTDTSFVAVPMFPWNHNGTVLRLATSCANAFVTSGRLRAGCFDGRVAFRIPSHMYTTLNKKPKEEQENLKPASPTNDATNGRIPFLLNTQFKKYPLESVAALMFMEISSIYWMHQVILHSGTFNYCQYFIKVYVLH